MLLRKRFLPPVEMTKNEDAEMAKSEGVEMTEKAGVDMSGSLSVKLTHYQEKRGIIQ